MRGYVKKGLILLTMLSMAVAAHAGNIVFTISGTLSLDSGVDSSGLDGATFTYTATFLDTVNYVNWGIPLPRYTSTTSVGGTSSVTITGTASNDGTYALGNSLFAPRYFSSTPAYPEASYIASETAGAPPSPLSFVLNDAETFSFQLQMTASASALTASTSRTVALDDFMGTNPVFYSADPASNVIQIGTGYYTLAGGAVAVPEGKYVSLAFGLAGLGVVGYRRYNRRKAA